MGIDLLVQFEVSIGSGRRKGGRRHTGSPHGRPWRQKEGGPSGLFSPIRTVTVGPGLSPGLLTSLRVERSARGLPGKPGYRRWGIPPRPENKCYVDAVVTEATGFVNRLIFPW